jgi:hypothetical protein
MFGPKPTSWTFPLDERATHMSLIEMKETIDPIFATPDSIRELITSFPLSSKAPLDVGELLGISDKLLETCVIHYEFVAIAVEKSFQAQELAMRIYLKTGKSVMLKELIKRLGDRGIFYKEEIELFDHGRRLRNSFAHPKNAVTYSLIMAITTIRTIRMFVSQLFPETATS